MRDLSLKWDFSSLENVLEMSVGYKVQRLRENGVHVKIENPVVSLKVGFVGILTEKSRKIEMVGVLSGRCLKGQLLLISRHFVMR